MTRNKITFYYLLLESILCKRKVKLNEKKSIPIFETLSTGHNWFMTKQNDDTLYGETEIDTVEAKRIEGNVSVTSPIKQITEGLKYLI